MILHLSCTVADNGADKMGFIVRHEWRYSDYFIAVSSSGMHQGISKAEFWKFDPGFIILFYCKYKSFVSNILSFYCLPEITPRQFRRQERFNLFLNADSERVTPSL